MSLGLAAIGANTGVVASDSICFSPTGKASYNYNKTFRLLNYPILAVHAGCLDFSGTNISEHINDILSKRNQKNLLDIVQSIDEGMGDHLSKESDCKVEILLLGREKLKSGKLVIHGLEFTHVFKDNINTCNMGYFDGRGAYAHIGDMKAREVIDKKFWQIRLESMNAAVLEQTIKKTMKEAIDNCVDNLEFPNLKACGGAVNVIKL